MGWHKLKFWKAGKPVEPEPWEPEPWHEFKLVPQFTPQYHMSWAIPATTSTDLGSGVLSTGTLTYTSGTGGIGGVYVQFGPAMSARIDVARGDMSVNDFVTAAVEDALYWADKE